MAGLVADRAVVLGGGMAGLLAARVLSEHYAEVLVIDRDTLTGASGPRRGVPHGCHAHALLARGQQILDELFPGLTRQLVEAGVPAGDMATRLRWYFNGRRLRQAPSGLVSVSATRPVLEEQVRIRVAALENVRFLERTDILGPTSAGARITGVRVRHSDGQEEHLASDLLIDATGRGSRTPAWLQELGYERPDEDRVKIGLAYTTRHFRLRSDPYGDDLSINPVASPANPRGAFFPKLPGDMSMLSLTGILGDHPPADYDGFLAFAKSLPVPDIYEAIRDAEPLDEGATFTFPASVRRRYERLPGFPGGLLVLGDGACSFNPVYGQGMTVAAMESMILRDHLRRGGEPRWQAFFKDISRVIDVPWDISAGADLAFPGVRGPRTLKVRLGNAYMGRLHAAAARDGAVTAAFMRVAGLVDPPQALMRPGLMLRVLANGGRHTTAEEAAQPLPVLRG
ncbi:FAD-dependent oxidoreductase [Nonomuraea gerenzanensis]|uniref:Probable secreted protein n=1 Tax=Nonomuraea gerenzanensis TaxID=93944 RepID=A0A1M4EA83_9ACTN|nr:FAD-dependent oxidoreductase [Nonomuraea gerenzanensis]UBU18914.1 FAD-dependent oxidoreductase [Nonomuraea gerenzanensis]SBO95821.1 Probable secreted protein [Nonomuraea gerenzanensis]